MPKLNLYSVELSVEVVVLAPDRRAAESTALMNFEDCLDQPDVSSVTEIRDPALIPPEWDDSIPFCEETDDYPEEEMTCQELFEFWKKQQEEAAAKAEQDRKQTKLFLED